MKKTHTMDFTTGSVMKKFLAFMLPLALSLVLQSLYNAADRAVVGQFAGKVALAAVGATGSATNLILNLVVGLATGAGIIIANLIGACRKEALRKNLHATVMMGAVCGVLIAIVGIALAKPILSLMDCPKNVLDLAALYMRIFFCGAPASMIYNFSSEILRAFGDSKRPMVILGVSGSINVVLNLVFVIVFKMSVAGVALATIISQYVSAFWVLKILFDSKDEYKLSFKELKLPRKEALAIIQVGLPCGVNGVLFSISNVIMQSTINSFGDVVIASSTASDSITDVLFQIIAATLGACVTFAGHCYGAKKYSRIDKLWVRAAVVCAGFQAAAALVATFIPGVFLRIFTDDPAVIEAGTHKLLALCWGYVIYAVSQAVFGCLRGMGKTAVPTIANIACVCVLRIVWVYGIYPLLPPSLTCLYLAYPVSYVFNVIAMFVYYFYCRRRLKEPAVAT